MPFSTTPGSIDDDHAFRVAFDSSPVPMGLGLVGAGGEYRSIRLNDALIGLIGRPRAEVESRMLLEFVHPDDREISPEFHRLMAGEIDRTYGDRRLVMPDGSLVWSRVHSRLLRDAEGDPLYLLTTHQPFDGPGATPFVDGGGMTADATPILDDLDRLADARRLGRRMNPEVSALEGVSRLAGGVAHDIGNLLGVIANYAEIASSPDAPEGQRTLALAGITGALERGSVLVRQLVQFARDEPVDLTGVDLSDAVASLRSWLEIAAGPEHRLEVDLQPVPLATADPRHVEQVVANLVINARDAMSRPGTITLTTAPTPDGDFVELRVADDGDGMTPEVLHRSVDPFFTTKAGGHASGLGLSICRGIVELSGGHFHVDSVNGQGTVVTSLWRTSESRAG